MLWKAERLFDIAPSNKFAARCNFISGVLMLSIFDIFYLIIMCIGPTHVKEVINVIHI